MTDDKLKKVTLYLSEDIEREIEEILVDKYGPFEAGRKKSEWIREALRQQIEAEKSDA